MSESAAISAPTSRWWLWPALGVVGAVVATVAIHAGSLDQRSAQALNDWNQANGGDLSRRWWSLPAFYLPAVLTLVLGVWALTALGLGLARERWRHLIRPGAYLLLVIALGLGVLVNATLKDHWGRPRPRDTVVLGGAWAFQEPWQPGEHGRGKSFPCGHAAGGALGLALWFLWRRQRPRLARWVLAGSILATAWIGFVRMLAGAHWLSDVVWAGVLMWVVAAALDRLVLQRPDAARAPPRDRPWLRRAGIAGCVVLGLLLLGSVLLATPFYRDLEMRGEAGRLGPGPFALTVEADRADITVELVPGLPGGIAATGSAQGFGWPGAKITGRFKQSSGRVDLALAAKGWFSERQTSLVVRADPQRLGGLRIQVGEGEVRVTSPGGPPPPGLSVHSVRGDVELPPGWATVNQPAVDAGR